MKLLPVLNAFRISRQRSAEVGQPSLAVWADAGEQAARDLGREVSGAAHSAQVHDEEAQKEIDAGMAGLADGRVDAEDLEHFRRASRLVAKSAEMDRKIGEAVKA